MTQTSITRTRSTASPYPRQPPSARQWWRCETAPGGATSPRCTWSPGRGPSATEAPPSSTQNTPRTLTAPRSTTTQRGPAAGSSPRCSWSPVRIQVPVSSTQRTCRAQTRGKTSCSSSSFAPKGQGVERGILQDPVLFIVEKTTGTF